ncbi:MAG: SMP-30/gluconolactonase/LRE family protein [Planctomycetaceae bacterium]
MKRFAMLAAALVSVPALYAADPARPDLVIDTDNYPTLGEVVRLDPKFDELIPKDAKIEVIASGFEWTEGPVWVHDEEGGYLLFSDIPRNSVYKWREGQGASLYMKPSGYTGVTDYGAEPGSNGLILDPQGRLVCCEHGDRRVSVLSKDGGKITLVDRYSGKRLNSPNDGCFKSNGDLYFTDPPYGLPNRFDDPRRELDFCGVYRLSNLALSAAAQPAATNRSTNSSRGAERPILTLLTDEMTRPNGIAFSPDEKTLYVAQSDPAAALWMAFPVKDDGTLGEGRVFHDATEHAGKLPGLPDGMKVDQHGRLFATGPGGVYVFEPDGTLLGRISTGERTSNCAWGNDGSVLYLTADMYLCRIKTNTAGAGWRK